MASGSLFIDIESLNKRELENECMSRGIQPIGLEKREMIRRVKEFDRKYAKGEGNEETYEDVEGGVVIEMPEDREEDRTTAGRRMTEEREEERTTAGRQMPEEREEERTTAGRQMTE